MIGRLVHVAARVLFVMAAVVVLTLAKTTGYGWTGPILIVAQIILVGLVRYAWTVQEKRTDEYIAWCNSANVEAWTTWHREYVAWSIEHRSRLLARPAAS